MRSCTLKVFAAFVLVALGGLSSSAIAQAKQKPEEATPVPEPMEATPVITLKSNSFLSCGTNLQARVQTGSSQSVKSGDNRFVRWGWSFGGNCRLHYRFLNFTLGANRYSGDIGIKHREENWKVSLYAFEKGLETWGRLGATLGGRFTTGLRFGVLETNVARVDIDRLDVKLGESWFDFTDFAAEHVNVDGKLLSLELGFDSSLRLRSGLYLLFGGEWQRVRIKGQIDVDKTGEDLLRAADVDPDTAADKLNKPLNLFYAMPGIKLCESSFCFSGVVFLGSFGQEDSSLGGQLSLEVRL